MQKDLSISYMFSVCVSVYNDLESVLTNLIYFYVRQEFKKDKVKNQFVRAQGNLSAIFFHLYWVKYGKLLKDNCVFTCK